MVTVILLNGVGSAGKSSIAKALQSITKQPFIHMEMDNFLEMMPRKYLDHTDGLSFEPVETDGFISTSVKTGPIVKCVLNGMRRSVGAMASSGNNLIVDEVIFGNKNNGSAHPMEEYQTLLKPYNFYCVCVFATLEVLEQRERERGDRNIGLSRWQYEQVHEGMHYDLSVNTDASSPLECADKIKAKFDL